MLLVSTLDLQHTFGAYPIVGLLAQACTVTCQKVTVPALLAWHFLFVFSERSNLRARVSNGTVATNHYVFSQIIQTGFPDH